MERGTPGAIVIVGQEPGRTELKKRKAFSGAAGKRLDSWLRDSGALAVDPREGIYFTSVLKCSCPSTAEFDSMAKNCRPFLVEQLSLIHPKLIISLGKKAYEALGVSPVPYERALFSLWHSREATLFPIAGFHYDLMVWPHPSGLNRLLNEEAHRERLRESFDVLRPHFTRNR
jgi:uracil-DNA glycosylase family 4